MTQETNELSDSRSFEYDAVGNLTERTDREGRVIEYVYDNLYRRTTERWKDGQSTIHTINFTYDAAGQMTSADDVTVGSDYDYVHDDLGRISQLDVDNGGPEVTLVPTYNAASLRTGLTAEIDATDDFENSYAYDDLGRLTRLDQEGQAGGATVAEKRFDFAYNAAGLFTSLARYKDTDGGSGNEVVTSTYSYDGMGRLTDLTHKHSTTTKADYDWTYDAAGRVTGFVSSVDGTSEYEYDNTHQLVDADHTYQTDEDYSYDENGNRTGGSYSTTDPNRLSADGTYNYTHDDEGNRTRRYVDEDSSGTLNSGDTDITIYGWDYRNRLTEVSHFDTYADYSAEEPDQVVEYEYDAFNRLIRRTLDPDGDGEETAVESQYVYDGDQIILEFDGSDDLTHRYLWGPSVDQVLADDAIGDEVLWPLADNLGTVRDLVDSDANVDNHRVYDAFGNITSETNSAVDHLFAFTGRFWDEDTTLQNNLNRWYDPEVGRWLSEDPIGFRGGDENLYRYVGNGPSNATDPSGLANKTVEAGVKGIKFFVEWFPNKSTGEIKVLTKKGAQLAIAKYMVNPKTGEGVVHVVATHGRHGKVLPGVASSALKKIAPKLTSEMQRMCTRVGGQWVLTRLADPAKTGGRLGMGRVAAGGAKWGAGMVLSTIMAFFTLENTCYPAEIERPEQFWFDPGDLGLSEEEAIELSGVVDQYWDDLWKAQTER